MKLLIVSGFLGAGKTTLILHLARTITNGGQRLAILVNEIGEIGIDDQLMRRLGHSVWELYSGCICCTLSGDLVSTLHQLDSEYQPDLVIVEPTGIAEPGKIHQALQYYRGRPLESIRTIGIIDPLRLPMMWEILTPLITDQIQGADLLLINKADLAGAEEIAQAEKLARELNPRAPIRVVSLRNGLEEELLRELLP